MAAPMTAFDNSSSSSLTTVCLIRAPYSLSIIPSYSFVPSVFFVRFVIQELFVLLDGFEGSLGGGEAGYRHAVWGAGDVVEADFVAEVDGRGVAAVLATDAYL